MLGRKERDQLELFITGSLRQLVPEDHILARVDRVLDLSWLRAEVADCYCLENGRPGIDPEVAVRLMLAGFLTGIVHDRRLLREAQVNIAMRWFIGYGLHEPLPDHSSLTRIRQRWGAGRFRRIFTRTVEACIAAKVATGEIVHIDSSLIRANVSWDAIARRHVEAVEAANPPDDAARGGDGAPKPPANKVKPSVCTTDPDATLAKSHKSRPSEPAYKHHGAVDGARGVVLDVAVTTGAVHDSQTVEDHLDAIPALTGTAIRAATMDAGFAVTRVFAALEARAIEGVVPTKAERPAKRGVIPVRRFKYDAKRRLVRCPAGKVLRPHGKPTRKGFQHYRARATDCRACRLRASCFGADPKRRAILLHKDHDALLRARRKHARWGAHERELYRSHRIRAEGYHGEAKSCHGLARAVRRGLANMQIQAYLTAAAVNLKRLAVALLLALPRLIFDFPRQIRVATDIKRQYQKLDAHPVPKPRAA